MRKGWSAHPVMKPIIRAVHEQFVRLRSLVYYSYVNTHFNVADLLCRPGYVDKVVKQYGIKMIKPVLPYVSFD